MSRLLLALTLAAAPVGAAAQSGPIATAPGVAQPAPAPADRPPAATTAQPTVAPGVASTPPSAGTSAIPERKPFVPPSNWVVIPRQPSPAAPGPTSLNAPTSPATLPGGPTGYTPGQLYPQPVVPQAVLPPRPTLPATSLSNQSEAQVRARLGQPQIARREAGGAMWTYATDACALMVFFQVQGREGLRVTGAQANPRQRGQRPPEIETCIAATAAAPRRG